MGDSPQHASKRDISYASRQSDRATVPQIQHVWKTPCPTAPGDGLQQRNSHRPGRPTYPDCIGGWLSEQARRSISYPRWIRTQSGQEFKYCVQPDQNKGSRFADNDNSFFMKKTKELYPIFLISLPVEKGNSR